MNADISSARTADGPDEGMAPKIARRDRAVIVAGLLGALAASSCCILPLALFAVGISGAWIGGLTALSPYQPIFIALTLPILGYGYYCAYGKPARDCAVGEACARPLPRSLMKTGLWAATVLIAAAAAFSIGDCCRRDLRCKETDCSRSVLLAPSSLPSAASRRC